MKVLITGADGFIAKNMIECLGRINIDILKYTHNNTFKELEEYIKEVDFIFHFAGVNRPKNNREFYDGNANLTQQIVDILVQYNKKIPILFTSSLQVGNGSDYAKSKELAERMIINYAKNNDVDCFIYRLPNVFGKWSKPNYNTVIATWCYNIARGIEIEVNDKSIELTLVYIDDVIRSFSEKLYRSQAKSVYCMITPVYKRTLGEIAKLLYQFRDSRVTLLIPNIGKGFERALYATYLSFLPKENFSYKLNGHRDERGTFYEILKTEKSGQLSISTTKSGITRGNHYHNTKNEKFLLIKGQALIELRSIFSDEVIQYYVSDTELEIVEMIPGYTHNIKNIGEDEMILLIWANENYNADLPDTIFLEV